jgi:signal transduction histidine kinase
MLTRSNEPSVSVEMYAEAFGEYAKTHSEASLYRASLLSQQFVHQGLGPEEIIALHGEAFSRACTGRSYREQARLGSDSVQFLLEVMIAYGVQHAEYAELKARELEARAEEDRRRAEEAEIAERKKSELMAQVAHELRTPLAAALGQVQLAQRSLVRGQMERIPRLLDSTRETLDRLSRLTADLMNASRGEMPELQYSPQEMAVIVRQACTWAAAVAEQQGVELVRGGGPFSLRVLGNADALLSVLGNLLANAIRYTPAGGRVTISYGSRDQMAWIEVGDTGVGMTPAVQARIFEQFYRGPEAHAIEAQGLGLGLTLVQRLIAAHDGRVEVESAPGRGSIFRVLLPRLIDDVAVEEAPPGKGGDDKEDDTGG